MGNSNALTFINHKMRTPLTAQEVNYWKLSISRILKIGAEFEFNLPDKTTGTCKGKSFTCPCELYGKEDTDCWTLCLSKDTCATIPSIDHCANVKTKCSAKSCENCKDYKFKCIGLMCSNNVPACITCNDFKIDCSTCIHRFEPNKNPDAIRKFCTNKFQPSGSYGIVSKSGVHNVVTDGSLLGKKGMEVITTGRRVDFWEFFTMSKDIIDTSVEKGAYINERCSIHMHGLASYYGKVPGADGQYPKIDEMERSIPEIVLANLHQLFRRYQNAITWMSSALGDPKHLTRWEKFRVSILEISAIPNNMRAVRDQVVQISGGNKYGWTNYKFCEFDADGQVSRLHVEVRVMDGMLSPSACAAFACLWYSMFIKAIELSRYGVIQAGDATWMANTLEVKKALMNNRSEWQDVKEDGRVSDTSNLHKYTDTLVAESFELISQLKHILSSVGPAYEVLEKLAENPCSMRRCDGFNWEQIEEQLKVELTEEGIFEYEIKKAIDTRELINVVDIEAWFQEMAQILYKNKDLKLENKPMDEITSRIITHVEEKQANGEMIWAHKIGSVINI